MGTPLRHAVTVEKLRRCLTEAVQRVGREGNRVLVLHYGRPIAALVPITDLELLEGARRVNGADVAPELLELFLAGRTR